MKIVVIDDHLPTLQLIEAMLKENGFTNTITFNQIGEALLYLSQEQDIDVILTDICMPMMNGIEFCQIIKQQEHLQPIPIVMITGCDSEKMLEEAFAAGAFDYIRKPFTMVELLARVRLAIQQKQMMDQLKETTKVYSESYQQLLKLQKQLEEDLLLAKSVQEEILPADICNEHICLHGKYIPSAQLSGDLYFWYQVRPHYYAVIVIDVMGHGVAASLVGMSIRSLLPGLMMRVTDPYKVMKELNRHVFQLFKGKTYYFTAIYAVIDTKRKIIEYVNAGHPPGLLLKANGESLQLNEGGIPIGLIEHFSYKKGVIHFTEPIHLFLYTDGLIDAWGKTIASCHERLQMFFERSFSSEEFIQRIEKEMMDTNREDDVTFVSVYVK
jgi:sigma-B regulation protein RsbU (phosphoserine phosphatase)